jgi:calcineurin-like phosphoesterase family protein
MKNEASKTYIITDLHFEHDKMQMYCNRPPDFGQKIINQWEATVNPQDIVYVLGDVTWGSQGQLKTILNGLPGTKILVRGNHDRNHSNNWFIQAGFAAVLEKAQVSGVVLSHFPAILTEEDLEYGIINIHGHFHNNAPKKWEPKLKKKITKNHFLLVLENVEYRPIDLQKARRGKFIYNSKKLLESESESDIK